MKEIIVETKIDDLKPSMKVLLSIEDVPVPSTIQVKADGELEYLNYNRLGFSLTTAQAYTLNKWGKLRTDFPALNQLIEALNKSQFTQAEILCELYAKQNGKPLILPQFIHAIKGKPPQLDLINIGIFDILTLNGEPFNEQPIYKWQTIEPYLKTCTNVHILPYMKAQVKTDVYDFWKIHVEKLGYEGIIVRNNNEIWKLKPKGEFDAVIIGINKESGYGKRSLFEQQQVPSLRLAVMTEEGNFIEVGDCASGLNEELRKALWKLMDYKVGEDRETVYVKPKVVVAVEYTETYDKERRILKFDGEKYIEVETKPFVSLRHPRLIRFRPDKTVNPQELRATQIPQGKPLNFTLYKGDCLKILPTLKNESIDLIITSPPYFKVKQYDRIEGEIGTKGNVEQYQKDLLEVFQQCYRLLAPTGVFCLNLDKGGEFAVWDFIPQIKNIGFQLIETIIWYDKTRRREASYPHLSHSYEPIFILAKTKQITMNKFSLHQNDVWEIINPKAMQKGDAWDRMTIATFPVKLIKELINLYSNPNDITLDLFAGSGTVMDVAQRLERNNISIEINPDYCEIIRTRCFDKHPQHKYLFQQIPQEYLIEESA